MLSLSLMLLAVSQVSSEMEAKLTGYVTDGKTSIDNHDPLSESGRKNYSTWIRTDFQAKFHDNPEIKLNFTGKIEHHSNKTDRKMYVDKEVDSITVASKGHMGMTVLRFSTEDGPRFGVQWHKTNDILNGSNPNNHFAVRMIGLFESNGTVQLNSASEIPTAYQFRKFTWSALDTFHLVDPVTNFTRYGMTTLGSSDSVPGRNPITVNLTAWYAVDAFNTTDGKFTPTGLKYSVNITGNPTTKLDDSHWKLVKTIFSNRDAASSIDSTTVGDGISALNWDSAVQIDGAASTITRDSSLNVSLTARANNTMFKSRDGKLDERCGGKNVVAFIIPRFTTGFFWDPVAYINEDAADSNSAFGTHQAAAPLALFATAITALLFY